MIKTRPVKAAVIAVATFIQLPSTLASTWQPVPELDSLEAWSFNPNSTVVEVIESDGKAMQVRAYSKNPDPKNHAVASAASPLFMDGGTLFFRLRFPAADGSVMNGRLCFAPARLNPGNYSCGFKFNGSEKISAAALNPTEAADKPAWLAPERWYWVWFSLNPSGGTASVTIRDSESDKQWEFKPGIPPPANTQSDPFSFFGIVIGGSQSPRPVQMADFRWSPSVSTDLPEGISP